MVRTPRLALTAALLLVLTGLAPGSAADEPTPGGPGGGPGGDPGNSAEAPGQEVAAEQAADQALEQAQALFGLEAPATSPESSPETSAAEAPEGQDATMVLRDLAASMPDLDRAERGEARRILARPTDGGSPGFFEPKYGEGAPVGRTCTADVCVHWVERTRDQVTGSDDDLTTEPAYVTQALSVLTDIHDSYRAAGYREPKADAGKGGGDQLDVYLADTGEQQIYGYCAVDEQPRKSGAPYDRHGYCVLDNDFSSGQFNGDPIDNLTVTAAHEYFHAVQFGYDWLEDVWLMEASSTWAESELYPGIKDNLQYLDNSPLSAPGTPLDLGSTRNYFYGVWIFLQHLTERWPGQTGPMATIVKDVWDGADTLGKRTGTDLTGVQAVQAALRERGSSWRRLLPEFGVANRRPAASYAQGSADAYPRAPLAARARLSKRRPADRRTLRPRHLTTATTSYVPTRSLRRRGWGLRVRFDLPRAGSTAVVTVIRRRGEPSTTRVPLKRGDGRIVVPFAKRRIRSVEVTLANADTRYERCFSNFVDQYSCFGDPKGDRFKQRTYRWIGPQYAVRAAAVRR